jgi:hypothetical protein
MRDNLSSLGVLRGRAARVHTTFRARLIKDLTNHCRNPYRTSQRICFLGARLCSTLRG